MNVDGIKNHKITAPTAKRRVADNSESNTLFATLLDASDQINDAAPVIAPSDIEATESIFATQAVEEREARRSRNMRAAKKGEYILDKLENLKKAILCGSVSPATIISLHKALGEKREPDLDPKLSAILDEIELRVEVELAKLEKVKKQQL